MPYRSQKNRIVCFEFLQYVRRKDLAGAEITLSSQVELDQAYGEILSLRDNMKCLDGFANNFRPRAIPGDHGNVIGLFVLHVWPLPHLQIELSALRANLSQ